MAEKGKVGFTTTIPLEILIAAGKTPVDLNNVFITSPERKNFVERAEFEGFPRNICSWVKGIFAVALSMDLSEVIAVTQGDCSNTQALMETLQFKGIRVVPFAYPYDRDPNLLDLSLRKMMAHYGVSDKEAHQTKKRLDEIRTRVHRIDRLTWEAGVVSGFENHFYQVCTSDMNGEPDRFEEDLGKFLEEVESREEMPQRLRLGYIGVPPIFDDVYSFLETLGARVVFNETQRQFSMPFTTQTLREQYLCYTYPYDIFARIEDIQKELARRRIHGLIHYVQSFCFRQIEDLILRKTFKIPLLTLEGDSPGPLDARSRARLESFIEMLHAVKKF